MTARKISSWRKRGFITSVYMVSRFGYLTLCTAIEQLSPSSKERVKTFGEKPMKVGRRRYWIYLLLFCLSAINYVDRIALSVSSQAIAKEFDLSPVDLGYLFSSFLWTYIICLLPVGMLVARYGTRVSNAVSISLWSIATMLTGAAWSFSTLIATR